MSVPVIAAGELGPEAVARALGEEGGLLVRGVIDPDRCRGALGAARALFALPREAKEALAVERSPHFRGWSEMHNERDFREQIHLGRELPAAGDDPPYGRLEGPNLWPADEAWRAVVVAYMSAAASLGERILAAVVAGLGLDPDRAGIAGIAREGYLVMKMIGYHAQPEASAPRPGVAAHVDFSWLTLTLQDGAGLSVRRPDGAWVEVAPEEGAVWVHAGELLELATRGRFPATPHRVINSRADRLRVSIPLFLAPPLSSTVPIFSGLPAAPRSVGGAPGPHVHRVRCPSAPPEPLHFGRAEWRRKGLGVWCADCVPDPGA